MPDCSIRVYYKVNVLLEYNTIQIVTVLLEYVTTFAHVYIHFAQITLQSLQLNIKV